MLALFLVHPYSGMTFVQNFINIHQLIQDLLNGETNPQPKDRLVDLQTFCLSIPIEHIEQGK
jgi:hypothetical protein